MVSGSGPVRVDTGELLAQASALGLAQHEVERWVLTCREILGPDGGVASGGMAGVAELDDARHQFELTGARLEQTRAALNAAALEYGATEREVADMWAYGRRVGAWLLGFAMPAYAGTAVATVALAGIAAFALSVTPPGLLLGGPEALVELLQRRGEELLSDPAFVEFLRHLVDHVDDFLAGAAHLPLPLTDGMEAAQNTAVLVLLAQAARSIGNRALVETPVSVRRGAVVDRSPVESLRQGRAGFRGATDAGAASRGRVDAPGGIEELLERVPDSEAGAPQVRVERYEGGWVVYVTGTIDLGLVPGSEPMDATSDAWAAADGALIGEQIAGAVRAAELALEAAGYRPGDPLVSVGHSLGGIVAARVAENHPGDIAAVVTAGSPIAGVPVPDGVPVLSLEHPEDPITALAGWGAPNDRQTVYRAPAFDGGPPPGEVLPAHQLPTYRRTGGVLDAESPEESDAVREALERITGGGAGETGLWRADRQPAPQPPREQALAPGPPLTSTAAR